MGISRLRGGATHALNACRRQHHLTIEIYGNGTVCLVFGEGSLSSNDIQVRELDSFPDLLYRIVFHLKGGGPQVETIP